MIARCSRCLFKKNQRAQLRALFYSNLKTASPTPRSVFCTETNHAGKTALGGNISQTLDLQHYLQFYFTTILFCALFLAKT
jgi:hypothetical protein